MTACLVWPACLPARLTCLLAFLMSTQAWVRLRANAWRLHWLPPSAAVSVCLTAPPPARHPAGTGLNAGAHNLAMLVIGRILLGFGIGSANSAVPLYLSETAPYKYRGALNMMFQLAVTCGILAAQLINYGKCRCLCLRRAW